MRRLFGIAIVALGLTAPPARAGDVHSWGFNLRVTGSWQWNCWSGCGPGCGPSCYGGQMAAPLAPWYLYYPLDAQFQVPAPITYPFWPAPQAPAEAAGSPLRPAAYQPAVPPYWYGR